MKTSWFAVVLLTSTVIGTQAQVGNAPVQPGAGPSVLPAPTPYAVVSRDANSRVWQRLNCQTSPSGQVVTNVHRFVEVATGLNYWSNGQWAESKEQIGILPNGGAAATNGQHQAYFPGDLFQGEIQLVTPDGKQLQSRPIGLSYDDGSNMVLIAELTNSVGYLVGSNQVVYPNAFSGINGDVRYTYRKGGFEQDLVLLSQLPDPAALGLNPQTTRLQLLTEFFNPPPPVVSTTVLPQQAGITLTDENLDFGVMKVAPGRAFLIGNETNSSAGNALVGKQWVQMAGRQILVEEVPMTALADALATLPVPQLTSAQKGTNTVQAVASGKWPLPPQHLTKPGDTGQPMQMARVAGPSRGSLPDRPLKGGMQMARVAGPSRGLVLDYQLVNGWQNDFTFQKDTTYLISGTLYISLTGTFEGGTVIKYATNA
jgi:hypothetical protein